MRGLPALIAAVVLAHGPAAQWIERDPETAWCCSAIHGDCEAVPGRVTYDGAWRVQGLKGELLDGQKGLYWKSPDGRPWACRAPSTNALRCLFMAPSQG